MSGLRRTTKSYAGLFRTLNVLLYTLYGSLGKSMGKMAIFEKAEEPEQGSAYTTQRAVVHESVTVRAYLF